MPERCDFFVQTVNDNPLVEAIAQNVVKHPVPPYATGRAISESYETSSRMTLSAGTAARMSKHPMRGLASIGWPCLADCRVYERTTNNRVIPLWLPLTIDWLWAHYWPTDERARWQATHRRAEHGTYSWPESWTNHRMDHPAPHHRPGNPPNWIRAVEYRAHGSAIKRPASVQGNRA